MCGIAGIFSFRTTVSELDIIAMTDEIKHRGPDGDGVWISDESQIGLGHRRLAIIDLSPLGAQPMHYGEDRFTITFNGEIYNYLELKEQLQQKGYKFKSQSDTEVLLALYSEKKERCLDDLEGMFAFAIWDNKEKTLFCARDRFGEKPFYFYKDDKRFVFASEMKALWKANVTRTVYDEQLFYYLNFDLVRNPSKPDHTLYRNVFLLEAAHYLKIDHQGKLYCQRYWDIDLEQKTNIALNEAKERFLALFTQSIDRRLRSDVAVGSSLSGGLDSSSIVAVINKIKGNNQVQKTFSARFENFEKDEGHYIDLVVDSTNTSAFYTWPDEQKFLTEFENLCYHQEEPFGSASIFAQWEVMKLAKEHHVTVLLDGQGADEIVAGYHHDFKKYYGELFRTNKFKLATELNSYEQYYGKKFNLSAATKFQSVFPDLTYSLKNSLISKFLRKNPNLNFDFYKQYADCSYPYKINFDLNKDLKDETLHYGLHELLRYADRNSMAFSREIRLPFLDYKIVEFLFSLPNEYKIKDGITKYIVRKSMSGIVPQEIIDRKEKIGYEPPQKKWMESKNINEVFEDSLMKLVKNGYIKKHLKLDQNTEKWPLLIAGFYI
jgi:asparagine synthase (glutamine-hydrolysing)